MKGESTIDKGGRERRRRGRLARRKKEERKGSRARERPPKDACKPQLPVPVCPCDSARCDDRASQRRRRGDDRGCGRGGRDERGRAGGRRGGRARGVRPRRVELAAREVSLGRPRDGGPRRVVEEERVRVGEDGELGERSGGSGSAASSFPAGARRGEGERGRTADAASAAVTVRCATALAVRAETLAGPASSAPAGRNRETGQLVRRMTACAGVGLKTRRASEADMVRSGCVCGGGGRREREDESGDPS